MMKPITLNDVIQEQLKDKSFAAEYDRELLINAIAHIVEGGADSRIPSLDMLARIANATQTKINITFEEAE